jgi:hypothetical protein
MLKSKFMIMKQKNISKVVVLLTVIALNVQWLSLIQDGRTFRVAEAQTEITDRPGDVDPDGYDVIEVLDPDPNLVVSTVTVPNTPSINGVEPTRLSCPWECGESYFQVDGRINETGYAAIPQMCTEADDMVDAIKVDIAAGSTGNYGLYWGPDSVYNAGERVSWDGLWVWDAYNITTGIGWTAWWVALANYCESRGYWSSSNKHLITYGGTHTLTFTMAPTTEGGTYSVNLLAKTTEVVRMQGTNSGGSTSAKTVVTPNFNSPFIYFDVPDGRYEVSLDSDWDMYQSVTPAFTYGSSWSVDVLDDQVRVNGESHDHLFYELAMNRIDLTRNGINFSSKDKLVEFLEKSDFFNNLHMTEIEKRNSLEYLIPRLEASPNYYLTVLSQESVDALSDITITPKPEQLVRTYYAVYPTVAPVKTTGGLDYPSDFDRSVSVVKEYGEIIIKPEMYVFWK